MVCILMMFMLVVFVLLVFNRPHCVRQNNIQTLALCSGSSIDVTMFTTIAVNASHLERVGGAE